MIAAAGLAAKTLGGVLGGTLGPALKGVATILSGPVGLALFSLTAQFLLFRKEIVAFSKGLGSELIPAIGEVEITWTSAINGMKTTWDGFVSSMRGFIDMWKIDWESLGQTIGKALAPIITLVDPIAQKLGGWASAIGKTVGFLFMWGTPLGLIWQGALLVVKVFQVIIDWVVEVGTAIGKMASDAWSWISSKILAPLGLVWDKFKSIMGVVLAFGQTVMRVAGRIGAIIIDKVIGALSSAWDWVAEKVTPAFTALGEIASSVLSWIGSLIDTWLITPLSVVYDWLAGKLAGAWDTFASAAVAAVGVIGSALSSLGSAIQFAILEPLRFAVRGIIQLADALNVDVPSSLREFVVAGAKSGLSGAASRVAGGVASPFQGDSEAFQLPGAPGGPDLSMGMKNSRQMAKLTGEAFGKAAGSGMRAMGGGMAKMADALKDEPCVKTSVQVDGKEIARANSTVKRETLERAGASTTPWQHRTMIEQGATIARPR